MFNTMSSSARDRLKRSKSARSMRKSRPKPLSSEPFDPEIARQHATAAASLAMRRSTERSSTDSQRSYDRLGGPSSMAVPQRRQRLSEDTQSLDVISNCAIPQSQPSISRNTEATEAQLSVAALPPITEFGGLDGRISSLPSSYRRLRKSRSMFSPRQGHSRILGEQSRVDHNATAETAQKSPMLPSGGALKRSMSFFRGNHQSDKALRHAKSHDAAIQMARSQFLQMSAENTQQRQESSINRARREHKPFRKTFRSSSVSGVDLGNISPSIDSSKPSSLSYGKTRSFSSSIKRGLKRVLGLSKATAEHNQIQLHHNCEPEDQGILCAPDKGNQDLTRDDLDDVCPTIVASQSQSRSVRSIHSSGSLASSRSRVTSWADSSIANTIVTRKAEQSHLSIIHERGDSKQNLTLSTPGNSPRHASLSSSTIEPDRSIDSQRLYAALMRRIGQKGGHGSEEEIFLGQVKEHRAVPTRVSSLHLRGSRQTVRRVPSDDSFMSPRSYATARGGTVTPKMSSTSYDNTEKELEDDNRSVTLVASQDSNKSDSPSVYSRTTSGESPVTEDHLVPETKDEPGVATIYESQRSTYSSPSRTPAHPIAGPQQRTSADWQQWMQSQMAGLEDFTPTREHYKEDAQIFDETVNLRCQPPSPGSRCYSSVANNIMGDSSAPGGQASELPITCKIAVGNNFSRPFSRSPSIRTIIISKDRTTTVTSPTLISRVTSLASSHGAGGQSPQSKIARMDHNPSSPMQSRSTNRPRIPETPTPKSKPRYANQQLTMNGRNGKNPTKWAPDQNDRFRSVRRRNSARLTNENLRVVDNQDESLDSCLLPQGTHSLMSSKHMVEMFLSSRRRQMGTEMSDDSAPDGAFV
ncbi:hypothetical protein BDV25DRAFT_1769 [Aspergillus avenaceus]|uniref:Uncharacterized protein n=1 Tax=Aspergillus avenaceus TaxID=36643 RepID=A0A5N6U695_ASPAV|nr:hypothetical protein BDV25DRAFT_1769 [Aspergillus avenaceus]